MARPRTGETPLRNVRVDDRLWEAVKAAAAERGDSMAQAVRWGLHAYLRRPRAVREGRDDAVGT